MIRRCIAFQSAGRIFGFAKFAIRMSKPAAVAFQSAGRIFGFAKARMTVDVLSGFLMVSIRRADFRLR